MKRRFLSIGVIALLFVAVIVGLRFTSPPDVMAPRPGRSGRAYVRPVDTQVLTVAQQLDKLAVTREESRYSRNALNLADNAVDLAFTSALRDAQQHPPVEDASTKTLHQRVRELEQQVKADEEAVKKLSSTTNPDASGQLQLLEAELSLHEDELDDARRDLTRAGGDPASRIQRQFDQHHATEQHAQTAATATAYVQRPAFQVPANMLAQARLWNQLRDKRRLLTEAQQQAATAAAELNRQHDEQEKHLEQFQAAYPKTPQRPSDASMKAM
jgi:hypothetical protein